MTPIQPTMLWESTDANAALARRFQFASSADAEHWLVDTIARVYGIRVESVARLVISSANLIAWLSTDTGPLLAKCCALVNHHNRLLQLAALLHWLDQAHLPVSAPLLANTGEGQVRCAHLSLGVQRVIAGELLDPTQLTQAQAAGVTLANLHKALAVYPHTPLILPHPRLSRHYKPSSRIGLTRNAQRGLIPSSWLASTQSNSACRRSATISSLCNRYTTTTAPPICSGMVTKSPRCWTLKI